VHLVAPQGEVAGDAEADELEQAGGVGGKEGVWEYERWYGAQYRCITIGHGADICIGVTDITSEHVNLEALTLPLPNKYLPDFLALNIPDQEHSNKASEEEGHGNDRRERKYEGTKSKKQPKRVPKLLRAVADSRNSRHALGGIERSERKRRMYVWHMADDSFRTPKAFVAVHISTWVGQESAGDAAARRLMINLLLDICNEEVYEAGEAGLSANITDRHGSPYPGVRLEVKGYSSTLGCLVVWLAQGLVALQSTVTSNALRPTFERVQRRTAQVLNNHRYDQASQHSSAQRTASLVDPSYDWLQKATEVAACTPECLAKFISRFLSSATLRILILGDVTADSAKQLSEDLAQVFGIGDAGEEQHLVRDERDLKTGTGYVFGGMRP
jgi:secreted Zn-dependent insulinase-like peptidase